MELKELVAELERKERDVAAEDGTITLPLVKSLQTITLSHVRDTLALARIVAALEARLVGLGILKD